MVKRIVWNSIALNILDAAIDYLNENYGEKVAKDYVKKVDERLNILSRYPEIGRKSNKRTDVRFYKIDKHKNLYYRIEASRLIVVYIFDTRQDPAKNPY